MLQDAVKKKGWKGVMIGPGRPIVSRWEIRCAAIDHAVAAATAEERAAASERHPELGGAWTPAAIVKARVILKRRFRNLPESARERIRDGFQHACSTGESVSKQWGFDQGDSEALVADFETAANDTAPETEVETAEDLEAAS